METGKMKLALSAGALALSMALAGCGGGGSSGTPLQPRENGNKTIEDSVKEAEDKVTAFATLVDGIDGSDANADLKDVEDAQGEAERYILAARTAGATNAQLATAERDLLDAVRRLGTKEQEITVAIEAQNKARETANKEKTDKAKALRAVLVAGNASGGSNTEIPPIGTPPTLKITLKKTDGTIAPLGDWKGTHYAGEETGTGEAKASGMRRVYSNKDEPKMIDFPESGSTLPGLANRAANGTYAVTATNDADGDANAAGHIKGEDFADGGLTTHTGAAPQVEGSYMDVDGTFTCTSGSGCTSTLRDTENGDGIVLAGTWVFEPDSGAKLPDPDDTYLQFGWWKRENSKGQATHARAFATAEGYGNPINVATPAVTGGGATYSGKAAGLFAISDGQRAADDRSGSFTADAELKAEFSGEDSTLTGTIDNFTLEDGGPSVNWSIALQKLTVNAIEASVNGETVSAGWFDSHSPGDAGDGADKGQTLWSINNIAARDNFGGWHARMYNAPAAEAPDNNNRPHAVVGTFYSGYSDTHRLRGGFAAER